MKKYYVTFLFCTVILFLKITSCLAEDICSLKCFSQNKSTLTNGRETEKIINENNHSCLHLPLSLTIIEESAFEGTAFTTINLPGTVVTIEDYAFANISTLKRITIPQSTVYIGDNAFRGSNQVTINGVPQSYAGAFAEKKGIPFSPIDSIFVFENAGQITRNIIACAKLPKCFFDNDIASDNSKSKQTGRLSGDITAARYKEFNDFHIQGRSPPMV